MSVPVPVHSSFRTDRNNNPVALITALAEQAGLKLGIEYSIGEGFDSGSTTLFTAKLLGDPIMLTISVINKLGFTTKWGQARWTYINMPKFVWDGLIYAEKRDVIGWMYRHEGGTEMTHLFPNYTKV